VLRRAVIEHVVDGQDGGEDGHACRSAPRRHHDLIEMKAQPEGMVLGHAATKGVMVFIR
jgi:hypothetical protein